MQEDKQVFFELKQGNEKRLSRFYQDCYSIFIRTLLKSGIRKEDASRIYPEAVTILFYNIKNEKLNWPMTSSLRTYTIAIGKHLIKNEKRKAFHRHTVLVGGNEELEQWQSVDYLDFKEKSNWMKDLLKGLGHPCQRLLHLAYVHDYSMESVANDLQLPSAGAARKRKFDCLKKLKELIKKSPRLIER